MNAHEEDRGPREYTVRIRRDFPRAVRPGAEQLDGKTFKFTYGWPMGSSDPYPGEVAYIPCRNQGWPEDAPIWIASGDLVPCKLVNLPGSSGNYIKTPRGAGIAGDVDVRVKLAGI